MSSNGNEAQPTKALPQFIFAAVLLGFCLAGLLGNLHGAKAIPAYLLGLAGLFVLASALLALRPAFTKLWSKRHPHR